MRRRRSGGGDDIRAGGVESAEGIGLARSPSSTEVVWATADMVIGELARAILECAKMGVLRTG